MPAEHTPAPPPGQAAASVGDLPTHTADPPADPTRTLPPPEAPPGYAIEGELGRGGMGVVYLARQTGLNRPVALKMVLGSTVAGSRELIRFLAEAEAVASVRHPHVVEVYQFGDHRGRPFLAMEYCPGRLPDPGGEPFARVADLMAKVAAGVGAAHAAGIVHRDLKPGNVLLTEAGDPKVTDFGLAKRLAGDSELTKTNAVMGTPAYMAPEQAQGGTKFVGPPADVWALGVMLYEQLTGRRPFEGDDTWQVLAAVQRGDYPAPRAVNPAVPRDLDLICRKCLGREPHERYETAGDLAADLRRWRAGEPILARPAGRAERLVKWGRRNPTRAAAWGLTALCLVMLAAGGGAVGLWRRAEAARAGLAAEQAATAAALEGEQAAKREADAARQKVERLAALRLADAAYRDWQAGQVSRAWMRLDACPEPLRGWEWQFVGRVLGSFSRAVPHTSKTECAVAVHPGGRRLAVGYRDGSVEVWEPGADKPVWTTVAHPGDRTAHVGFGPDGKTVRTSDPHGRWAEWDVATGKPVRRLPDPSDAYRNGWTAADGSRRCMIGPLSQFSPTRLDPATGAELGKLVGHTARVQAGAFRPDAKRVVTWADDETARVWDADTGAAVHTFLGHTAGLTAGAWSADGKRLATGDAAGLVLVWDADTGTRLTALRGHAGPVRGLTFSPAGDRLASGGEDRTARVWDVAAAAELAVYRDNREPPAGLAFTPHGDWLAVTGGDYVAVAVRDATADPHRRPLVGHGGERQVSWAVAYTPDGREVLTVGFDQHVRVWDAATGRPTRAWKAHDQTIRAVAVGPDGTRAVTGSNTGSGKLWELATGKELAVLRKHDGPLAECGFLADGRVVTAGTDQTVRIWDVAGKEVARVPGFDRRSTVLAVRPGGREFAVRHASDDSFRVYDAAGRPVRTIPCTRPDGTPGDLVAGGYSADGRRLVGGVNDQVVVWDADTGAELTRSDSVFSTPQNFAVTPAGDRVAVGLADGQVLILDLATGAESLALRPERGVVRALAFHPDGRSLAVACDRGPVLFGLTPRRFAPP